MLSKFIENLQVKLYSAEFREILKPFSIVAKTDSCNTIVMINRGQAKLVEQSGFADVGSFFFFPAGKKIAIQHGDNAGQSFDSYTEILQNVNQDLFRVVNQVENMGKINELVTFVRFDVNLFGLVPFFKSLDLPAFQIPPSEELSFLIRHLAIEQSLNRLGRDMIINNYTEELLVYLCRYIDSNTEFKERINQLEFFTDRRLFNIVKFITDNLENDLSNKAIADIAFISEDYVGQYFKSLTGKNLQEYIEYQRLERAMLLLKTMPENIQMIAKKVGFKDPAYFSRRFKLRYGINANSVRQNKSQLA